MDLIKRIFSILMDTAVFSKATGSVKSTVRRLLINTKTVNEMRTDCVWINVCLLFGNKKNYGFLLWQIFQRNEESNHINIYVVM